MGLSVFLALASCSARGPAVAPTLEPGPDAPVWPKPPETPRYALAGTLIGERDFLAAEDDTGPVRSALSWLAGIVVGEPDYIELRRPMSGLTDDLGRVLVIDASHQAVVVFDMDKRRLRLWREAARGVRFVSPIALSVDGAGGFLVTDSELGEVFRLGPDGSPRGRFGKGILDRPTGIARDPVSGHIYVADTARHNIKVFNEDGTLRGTIGRRGTAPGEFNAPTHLLFRNNRLYVADTLNFRIQILDRTGDGRLTFGRLGLFVGELTRPKGVAVGGNGRIYVVESYYDHLLVFAPDGKLLLPIGGTGRGIGQFARIGEVPQINLMLLKGLAQLHRRDIFGFIAGSFGDRNLIGPAEGHTEFVVGDLEQVATGNGVFRAAGCADEDLCHLPCCLLADLTAGFQVEADMPHLPRRTDVAAGIAVVRIRLPG
ncbi:MAG: hypothetical protein D6826_07555, partial [Alphaproteobacteria bacterium]